MDLKEVKVYRFRDSVAINLENETIYLSVGFAHLLGKTLTDVSFDILTNQFSKSTWTDTVIKQNPYTDKVAATT